jgi:NmrA-like family
MSLDAADGSCFEGAFVLAAFLHPEQWLNKDLRVTTDFYSARDIAAVFSEVSGKTVHIQEVDEKAFDALKNNGISEELHAKYVTYSNFDILLFSCFFASLFFQYSFSKSLFVSSFHRLTKPLQRPSLVTQRHLFVIRSFHASFIPV